MHLALETPPIVLGRFFWNFTCDLRMVWTLCFCQNPEIIFVTFHFSSPNKAVGQCFRLSEVHGAWFRFSSRYLVFHIYLILKNEEVQNAVPILFFLNVGGYKFTEFACFFLISFRAGYWGRLSFADRCLPIYSAYCKTLNVCGINVLRFNAFSLNREILIPQIYSVL